MHTTTLRASVTTTLIALTATTAVKLLTDPPTHNTPRPHRGELSPQQALALYSPAQRTRSFDACKDLFPDQQPVDLSIFARELKPMALCSNHFATVYSPVTKTPLMTIERLSAQQLEDARGEQRSNEFFPDPRLAPNERAELSDYRRQTPKVDRGHMAPAGDAPDQDAMQQTFALSNMVPQDPRNNQGAWRKIETDVRKFAHRSPGYVFVYTGPLFDLGHDVVGPHQVWKPTRLFKLVYPEHSGRIRAYIIDNDNVGVPRPVDYDAFVKTTTYDVLKAAASR